MTNKDKFILLFCPQPTKKGRRMIPMGLLAISAYLDKEGYTIKIVHSYDKDDQEKALADIDKAICIGITSMTGYQIYDGLQFAKRVREKNSKIPIVWGGIHPTILPEQTLAHPLVDMVVVGQGERTFTELIHRLENNESLEGLAGLMYKVDGQIKKNQTRMREPVKNFLPLPYHVLGERIQKYIKRTEYGQRTMPYITSQGCPFRCTFCYVTNSAFKSIWDGYPADRVVDEIEKLIKTYNVDAIEIKDANFFVDQNRIKEICLGIIDRGIKVNFMEVNGRTEQLVKYDNEMWQLLKKAGFCEILIGAESGDQEMLDLINKRADVTDTLKVEKRAKEFKINILNSFMTGFPPVGIEKDKVEAFFKKELNATIDLLNKIFEANPTANSLLFFYTPYPGTTMYQQCLEVGFKAPQDLESWSKINLSERVTPWISDRHYKNVILLRTLLTLKKATSSEYVRRKTKTLKRLILKYLGIYTIVQWWVSWRLKHKFFYLGFETFLIEGYRKLDKLSKKYFAI